MRSDISNTEHDKTEYNNMAGNGTDKSGTYNRQDSTDIVSDKGEESDNNQEYSLYTEKIVVKPSVKYKKLILLGWVLAAGCIFGAAASVIIVLFAPNMYDRLIVSHEERETLRFEKDEYPQEPDGTDADGTTEGETVTMGQLSDNLSEAAAETGAVTTDDYVTFTKALKKIVSGIQKSIVSIDIYESDMDDFIRQSESSTETIGAVIGTAGSEYIILTNYTSIADSDSVVVKLSDSVEVNAQIIGSDKESNMALLAVKESSVPSAQRAQLSIARLGNSYKVSQGDIAIAAGRINGVAGAIDYCTITEISTESGLDNSYQVMDIGLACKKDDFSFIFATNGNLIGLAFYSEENEAMSVIGISDMKSAIQALSSGNGIEYMGIYGQNVTSVLATRYGLPMGIYINEVQMDSPAYNAGIQSGDVITAIDEEMVLTIQAFSEKLYQCENGQQIQVMVKRLGKDGYKEVEFPVTVSVRY